MSGYAERFPNRAHLRHHQRPTITLRTLIACFVMASICVPQLLLSVPDISEQIKTPDLFAVLTIPIALVLYATRRSPQKVQLLGFLAIGFAATVVFGRILLDDNRDTYRDHLPHLARLFSIFAPLFLVVVMPRDRKVLMRCIIGFGLLATCASLAMAVLYHFGSSAFDAHQTFSRQGGDLTHRLGGLQGESGGYAFNATLSIQLLLVGLAMARYQKRFYLTLWIAFPLYMGLIYHESLARISLLNSLVFFAVTLIGVNHSKGSARFILLLLILVGAASVLMLSAAEVPLVDLKIERVTLDGSLDQLSSGRVSNWSSALETWSDHPSYLLFGMGHRASDFVLAHPVENMLVFHLTNYGIIGTAIFALLYGTIAWPILLAGIRGDCGSGVFSAILLSVLLQWQVNDVNLYYQTFPWLLFFAAWYASTIQTEKFCEGLSQNDNAPRQKSDPLVKKPAHAAT